MLSIFVEKASTHLISRLCIPIFNHSLSFNHTHHSSDLHTQPNTPFRMIIPRPIIIIPSLSIQFLRIKPKARTKAALGGFGLSEAFAPGGVVEVLVGIAGVDRQHLVFFSKDCCPINSKYG